MRNHVLLKVFISILLAILAGWLTGPDSEMYGIPIIKIYTFIGQLFLNALNLVVVPLVCASIVMGTARMGAEPSFGLLGAKTFGFYFLTSALAVIVGLGGYFLLSPSISSDAMDLLSGSGNPVADLAALSQGDTFDRFTQIFLKFIPSNILAAASQGQMLGLIVFSILFGCFISKIDADAAAVMMGFWKGIFQIMMRITHLVMRALPIGVFGLVAKVVALTGLNAFASVGLYFAAVVASMLVYALAVLPMLLSLWGGVKPVLYFRAMAPAILTAFSTSSSAATLPVTMECLEKRVGISNRICSFSLPLGTSINMSGGALFLCIASLFIAHAYGVEFSFATLSLVAILSLLTSMGIAGIPSASLISLMVILQTLGVPAEGIGLIMAVDRILDMFRTTVNVLGNSTCATLLARSEGEQEMLAMPHAPQSI